MLKKILIGMFITGSLFAVQKAQILGITEPNELSPIETKTLGELSPQAKEYINQKVDENLKKLYETKIKKDMQLYLSYANKKLAKKYKEELRKIVYDLKKQNGEIIAQNKLLLKRYNYLLKKYLEARIITIEDLKRLMVGQAVEIHDKVIYKKTLPKQKNVNLNQVFGE